MKKIKSTPSFVSANLSQTNHHSVQTLKKRSFQFIRMEPNRFVPDLAVSKLTRSILSTQAVLQPILVIAAQAVVDAGIAIYYDNGDKIDPKVVNLDKMLCIVDGQTRYKSYMSICQDKSIDSSKITCTCAFPQTDKIDIAEMLSTIAGTVRPWCSLDHQQSLVDSWKDEPSLDLTKLRWICELAKSGASETAALYWGNFVKTRAISKARYRSATKVNGADFEKHKAAMAKIAERGDYEYGYKLYSILRYSFLAEHLGVYCIPAFFIDKMAALQADGMSKDKAYKVITNFAKSFNVDMAKRVTDALGAGARKKDTETRTVLEDLYVKFKETKK
ncbi:MAG: hypothetical protein SNG04_05890 [Rikenellaceae bacterium]